MTERRRITRGLWVMLGVLVLFPAAAWAQSGMTGVVRDTSSDVLGMVTRFGPAWQQVSSVLPPRMIKLAVQVDC